MYPACFAHCMAWVVIIQKCIWNCCLFTSYFPCQEPLHHSVSGSRSVCHLYSNLWELGVLSIFWGLYFYTKWSSIEWLNTCQYCLSRQPGSTRPQSLDITVSQGVFLMGFMAKFLLSFEGTVLWGFCLWRMKTVCVLNMSPRTGHYLCSFGTRLCLHLSHQEAGRG